MSQTPPSPASQPIAVVGVSALFPGSLDASGFWRDILAGRDLIDDVPPSHWLVEDYYDPDPRAPDKTYARRGGFLGHVDFDALGWGVPPNIIPATDTSQLLALILARRVLEDAAGAQFETMDRSRISVILGVTSAQELLASMVSRLQRPVWVKALRESGLPEDEVQAACDRIADHYTPWQESSFPGLLGNVVAGRIANRLNTGGTNCVTDAACASTFSALAMGISELQLGTSDLVISGGVDTLNDIFMFMCFSKTPALSASGDCRPFSDRADGTMLGEGLGMVALKRLADAERDGDRIYAVIKGVGTSSDGRSKSVYAPVSSGQARALRRAYARAGYGPETVELVEAHGTGTIAGDAAEFEGLRMVFDDAGRADRQWCSLGSVKSQIGHTKAAAGAAGLFKAIMALHHKVLPPTIKIDRPNPALALEDSPFSLNTRARPWIRGADHPRRASVSSFGFGGSNFHVTLEEYTGATPAERLDPIAARLLLISAADGAGAVAEARALAGRCRSDADLAWAARQSQGAFDATAPARMAVIADSPEAARSRLDALAARVEADPERALLLPDGSVYATGPHAGEVAFVFPGQGSQAVDMGAELAMAFDAARAPWDRAAALGIDLHGVCFPRAGFADDQAARDAARLTATENAQPAIGCTSLSMLALLDAMGLAPARVAGHSFGEVTALYAAGVIGADDMLRVARRRGELMAEAAQTPGAMLAVRAPIDAVRAAVEGHPAVVVANHNGPRQVVLSGPVEAIDAAQAALSEAGMSGRRLPVATAFHSPVVAEARAPFAEFLGDIAFAAPARPVYANVTAAPHAADGDAVKARLAEQLVSPVRFVEMIEAMYADGVRTFVEVGPGAVLTGLIGRILGDRPHRAVPLDRKGRGGVESFLRAVGELAVAGLGLDVGALWRRYRAPIDPATVKKARLAVPICGSNHGKPYPPPGGAAELPPPNPPRPASVSKPVDAAPTAPSAPPAPRRPSVAAARPIATPVAPPRAAAVASSPVHAPTVAVRRVASGAPRDPSPGWLQAFEETQRQTAQAHAAYQETMARAHEAFLETMQTGLTGLATMLGAAPAELGHADASQPAPRPMAAAPAAPPTAPAYVAPQPQPQPAPVMAPKAAPIARPKPAPAASAVDLKAVMLAVVAEKTGYPADMLTLEMDLEGDLGIDSIKRVEILAAVREAAPGLPELDPSALGALATLGEIVAHLDEAAPAAPAAAPKPTPAAPAVDLKAVMLAVVAEKTGYPADMLTLEMDLEGDLGIDSIKRVEILAAVREAAPELPEIEPAELGALQTLGAIVAHFEAAGSTPLAPPADDAPSEPTAIAPPGLGRFELHPVGVPAAGFALPGLFDGEVLITPDGGDVAPALARALTASGVRARVVEAVPPGADRVVFLGGLRPVARIDDALAVDREAFGAARTVARGAPALWVTVQDTGGAFGFAPMPEHRAWLGGLPAMTKTADLEWPDATTLAIDIERAGRPADAIAAALADELLRGGGEAEVGLRADGRRITLRSVAVPVERAAEGFGADSVFVVSGGARGVTARCVIAWAEATGARFALLGRTPLTPEPACCAGITDDAGLKRALLADARARGETPTPAALGSTVRRIASGREIRATLAAVEAAGGQARYVAVDVTDGPAVAAALDGVRAEWGPITGVVHGAGVLADKRIAEKTDAQFERVFRTKIDGLRALLDATAADDLALLCVFSSVSGRCGNTGQAVYALSNEILAKVCLDLRRRRPGMRVKSLGWGPWAGGMVTPALAKHFASLGVPLIPLDVGARMMVDELSGARPDAVELVLGGEPRAEALRMDGSDGARVVREIRVDEALRALLAGHAVAGGPVVPMALVAEWFARMARAVRPGFVVRALHGLQVLKGIRLDGDPAVERLVVSAVVGDRVQLMLHDAAGVPRYRAEAEMGVPGAIDVERPAAPAGPWNRPIYGGALFHEGRFRVVERVDGIADGALAATLNGVSTGWPGEWAVDVAALDGALQAALLLTEAEADVASLPTRVETVRLSGHPPTHGPLTCVLHRGASSAIQATSQAVIGDRDGRPVMALSGITTVARPR